MRFLARNASHIQYIGKTHPYTIIENNQQDLKCFAVKTRVLCTKIPTKRMQNRAISIRIQRSSAKIPQKNPKIICKNCKDASLHLLQHQKQKFVYRAHAMSVPQLKIFKSGANARKISTKFCASFSHLTRHTFKMLNQMIERQ